MRILSIFMLTISILYAFSEVNSAGVTIDSFFTKSSQLSENNATPSKTQCEFINNFEYKLEVLSQVINKMDNSLQHLQEKSHNWIILQHQINSWNEGIRVLDNKINLLKRTVEEQDLKFQELQYAIANNKISERCEVSMDDVKKMLNAERKNNSDMAAKINNILRHAQLASVGYEKKSSKTANFTASIGVAVPPYQYPCTNATNRIEQQLNTMSHQIGVQSDLKELNSIEKRNSKSLEHINQVLGNQLNKYDEITKHLRKSNEYCYSVTSELTTFTESSDILLKRIEKLVRSVSDKINDIDLTINDKERCNDNVSIDNDNEEFENRDTYSSDDSDKVEDHKEVEHDDSIDINESIAEKSKDESIYAIEFLRPMLTGCHELQEELSDSDDKGSIDGIYKFLSPDINQNERDFNERYCVFAKSPNDTGPPWTVIQRRGPYPQQENFNRSWSEYRNGFGHLSRDFWFGNEFIHRLVYYDDYELRIELEDFADTQKWAEYSVFRVDSEKYNYNLLIGEYRGTIEDAMKYHNDNDFSTYDKRNDKTVDACCPCAMGYASGWWFDNCSEANLNGIYHYTPLGHNYIGIMWELWHDDYSLKKTRMMIRPHRSIIVQSQDYQDYTEDP